MNSNSIAWEKNESNFFSYCAPFFSVTQLITFNYFWLALFIAVHVIQNEGH